MALKVGVVGTGFARSFIPLFQAHPLVEEVVLAERLPDRLRDTAREFGINRTCPSLTDQRTGGEQWRQVAGIPPEGWAFTELDTSAG